MASSRLTSIGASIAVAPAILLGYGNLVGATDVVEVASSALFAICLPIGAVLVAAGLLTLAKDRFLPAVPAINWSRRWLDTKAWARSLARLRSGWLAVAALLMVVISLTYMEMPAPSVQLGGPAEPPDLLNALMSTAVFWIAVELLLSLAFLFWILCTRRPLLAVPYIVYWAATVLAALLADFDRPSSGTWGSLFAVTSAMLLSYPWISWVSQVPWLAVAATSYESVLKSYFEPYDAGLLTLWTAIAINQVLLGLLAAAASKKPEAPAAGRVPAPTKWLAGVFAPLAIFGVCQASLALSLPADRWERQGLLTAAFAILVGLAAANSFVVRMRFRKATHVFVAGLFLPAVAGLLEFFFAKSSDVFARLPPAFGWLIVLAFFAPLIASFVAKPRDQST